MPSIINGLFSGRSGIASHGTAIAVVGDNISNASTIGFKSTRAEFEDLVAGGQAEGRIIGSGSSISAVSTINQQGTLEFTGRALDLAIDGNGLFVVAEGAQRFYTRAGNFRLDAAGYLVAQDGKTVLGFPAGGTGRLEPINVNTISQDSVATTEVAISGNLDASATLVTTIPTVSAPNAATPSTTTYEQLSSAPGYSTVVEVFDSLGEAHTVTIFFFKTGSNQYTANAYVNSEDVDTTPADGLPRLIGSVDIDFNGDGTRAAVPAAGTYDIDGTISWTNGSDDSSVGFLFAPFTQFSSASNILSITQDGQGSEPWEVFRFKAMGGFFALLDNGQSAIIGTLGLVNFSNPEGLTRLGGNLLQQSPESGEPVIGRPQSGTFGGINAGSIELSTVDIANEFVRLITLQRGFQASSRIITTINQLLNDIIQLA